MRERAAEASTASIGPEGIEIFELRYHHPEGVTASIGPEGIEIAFRGLGR